MLAYGAGEFVESRRFYSRAVGSDRGLLLSRQAMSSWLKASLGPGVLDLLKGIRYRIA
jgi:hypothetical protein